MIVTRRTVLATGGGLLASLALPRAMAQAPTIVDIAMTGRADGSKVWFDPIGMHVAVGQTIRWTNRDRGNSHTATAYHPANFGWPQRMPEQAAPWDSDYLLPGETFAVTLDFEGVYDYYCLPHEHAGMVGRIVVGLLSVGEPDFPNGGVGALPAIALDGFPTVEAILARGTVAGG